MLIARFQVVRWEAPPGLPKDLEYVLEELGRNRESDPKFPQGVVFFDAKKETEAGQILEVGFLPEETTPEAIEDYLKVHSIAFLRADPFLFEVPRFAQYAINLALRIYKRVAGWFSVRP